MRILTALLIASALVSPLAAGQAASVGDYTSLSLDFGSLQANMDGTLKRLSGGAKITLMSDKPDVKPLPIQANEIEFDWTPGQSTPTAIIMEGNVQIEHPQAQVKANKAEWNFEQGTLTFTGNPVMTSEMFKEMRGNSMTLNFNTGQIEVSGAGRLAELPLGGGGAPGASAEPESPHFLTAGDVNDWAGLITAIRTQAQTQGPSPGRQIVEQLPRQAQSALLNMPPADLAANPGDLAKQFNGVLRSKKLYNAEAWQGITLSEPAQALLDKQERTSDEQIQLNRLLLQAAYPNHIK